MFDHLSFKRPSIQNAKMLAVKPLLLHLSQTILGDQGAGSVSLNGREKMARRKVNDGFSRQFRPSLAPSICPWVSEEVRKRPPFVLKWLPQDRDYFLWSLSDLWARCMYYATHS